MTTDEMAKCNTEALFDIAPREETTMDVIPCPACEGYFWVKGGYEPHYTTGLTEDKVEKA